MAAASAVFGTYELLEGILELIEPQNFLAASKVCKTWRKIIADSERLHFARCLKPKYTLPKADAELHEDDVAGWPWPYYEYSGRFKVNKAFTYVDQFGAIGPSAGTSIVVLDNRYNSHGTHPITTMTPARDRYISHPPLSRITVRIGRATECDEQGIYPAPRGRRCPPTDYGFDFPVCSVRNDSGITVGEVLDAVNALRRSWQEYLGDDSSHAEDEICALGFADFRMWDNDLLPFWKCEVEDFEHVTIKMLVDEIERIYGEVARNPTDSGEAQTEGEMDKSAP